MQAEGVLVRRVWQRACELLRIIEIMFVLACCLLPAVVRADVWDNLCGQDWNDPVHVAWPNRLLYDSFGRLPSVQWQPRLVDVETTERDAEQPITYDNGAKTEYCGQASLAFACVAHAYGYNVARLV